MSLAGRDARRSRGEDQRDRSDLTDRTDRFVVAGLRTGPLPGTDTVFGFILPAHFGVVVGFYQAAGGVPEGNVGFLDVFGVLAGAVDDDVAFGFHGAAVGAGEDGGGDVEGFGDAHGHAAVAGVAGGADGEEDVAGACEGVEFLGEGDAGDGDVVFDGGLEGVVHAEGVGAEAGFEVVCEFVAEGEVFEAGLEGGVEGALAFEALVEFADDVGGVGHGAAVAAGEEGAAIVVGANEFLVELEERGDAFLQVGTARRHFVQYFLLNVGQFHPAILAPVVVRLVRAAPVQS